VIRLRSRTSTIPSAFPLVAAAFLVASCFGQAGTYPSIQEVRVSELPVRVARSHERADVLRASLSTIVHDKSVCCGKDSALEDSVERADPLSLQDTAAKLQGRHLLSDGSPIMVTATYIDPQAVNGALLIATLREKHAVLLGWNSHLYVCYGVTYREDYDADGGVMVTILTFLLIDPRHSGSRRDIVFDRATDDWSKVQGMLWVSFAPQ